MSQKGMDIASVDSQAQVLKTGAQGLDELTTSVAGLKGPLAEVWEGVEAEAAVEFINTLSTKMQDMSVEVMKIHDWVINTKQNYEETASKGAQAYQF